MIATDEAKIAEWCSDNTFLRIARKPHHCCGGFIDGKGRTKCDRQIERGERYVEYLGETPLWQSGHRYHLEPCARENGFLQ